METDYLDPINLRVANTILQRVLDQLRLRDKQRTELNLSAECERHGPMGYDMLLGGWRCFFAEGCWSALALEDAASLKLNGAVVCR